MAKKVPEGFATITPTLVVDGAAKAIEQYKKAFGATEDYRMEVPGNKDKIMHACLTIGNSKLFICDVQPQMCATPTSSRFYLYFDDVDAMFKQAKGAGCNESMAPQDMFWGDRMGAVTDNFGIHWSIATFQREVSDEELKQGAKKMGNKAA